MSILFHVSNFLFGMLLTCVGFAHLQEGIVWGICLFAGGVYIGHVVTEVLNDHVDIVE